jgi:hypothetical protein
LLSNISKAHSAFEMPENTNPATEYHIPEELNPCNTLFNNLSLLLSSQEQLSRITNTFVNPV